MRRGWGLGLFAGVAMLAGAAQPVAAASITLTYNVELYYRCTYLPSGSCDGPTAVSGESFLLQLTYDDGVTDSSISDPNDPNFVEAWVNFGKPSFSIATVSNPIDNPDSANDISETRAYVNEWSLSGSGGASFQSEAIQDASAARFIAAYSYEYWSTYIKLSAGLGEFGSQDLEFPLPDAADFRSWMTGGLHEWLYFELGTYASTTLFTQGGTGLTTYADGSMRLRGYAYPVLTTVDPAPVPEPATVALFGTGLAALFVNRWRRRKPAA